MVSGLIMLGGIVTHRSPVTLQRRHADRAPHRRVRGDRGAGRVAASARSRDLLERSRARPESISWGGGSAGGSDQILAGLVADAVGVAPRRVNYIAFSGGGESLSAILGGQVSVGINGLAEFAPHIEAGTLRALAISSAERLPGVDVPTLREQGVDVEFENWRSLVAPPGISRGRPAAARALGRGDGAVGAWREALDRYRWLDRYLAGDGVRAVRRRRGGARADILRKLGTGGATRTPCDVRAAIRCSSSPAWSLTGGLRGACATCARGTAARRRAASAARRRSCSWRPASSLHLLLLERAGFVIAAAVLFWLPRAPSTRATRCATRSSPSALSARLLRALRPPAAAVAAGRPAGRLAVSAPCDTLELLRDGFASALTWPHLAWAFGGVTLGTAVGVLPGIGPALTVALLLPVTFSLDPVSAFIMFGGIYYGAMYGGSTTSILLNTPGETASIVTAIDGYMMARQGRGAAALATAAIGSFVAGTLATIALTFFAPPLASVALRFGPAEYFALTMLAFTTVAALLGASLARGLFSLFLGLALGLVGIDQLTGNARFSFGIPQLLDGIDVMILVIGLFAVGETLYQAWRHGRETRTRWWRCRVHRHEPRGLAALVEAVAARHGDRVSARRAAVRRLGDPDVRLLHRREAPERATRGVRARGDRGRGRAGGRQQRGGGRRAGAAAHARACPRRPPRPCCWRPSSSTGCSRARCCSRRVPIWCGR